MGPRGCAFTLGPTPLRYPGRIRPETWSTPRSHVRPTCGCRAPLAGIGWPEMSTTSGPEPSLPGVAGDAAVAALVAAMESAPAAIYCLTAAAEPVWANARARALGTQRGELPHIDGRAVADVVDDVLRTGRPETLCGALGEQGTSATVIVRPMRVGDGPGVLVVLEPDDVDDRHVAVAQVVRGPRGAGSALAAPAVAADAARPAALGQLPPGLLGAGGRRGLVRRGAARRAAGSPSWSATPWGTACPPPAR